MQSMCARVRSRAGLWTRRPPVFEGRPLGLRGFDAEGMLKEARLAMPGEADARIRELFANPDIATIHVHNAAHGCFSALVERSA